MSHVRAPGAIGAGHRRFAAETGSWLEAIPSESIGCSPPKVTAPDKARLAVGPVVAFAKTKDAINAATLTELEPALEREFKGQSGLLRANDLKEGTKAFQEKRAPVFTDS